MKHSKQEETNKVVSFVFCYVFTIKKRNTIFFLEKILTNIYLFIYIKDFINKNKKPSL